MRQTCKLTLKIKLVKYIITFYRKIDGKNHITKLVIIHFDVI